MKINIHPHAMTSMNERGISLTEINETIISGESFDAKFGRTGFRKNFNFENRWRGAEYNIKQVEVFAVKQDDNWLVITVISKYF